MQDEKPSAGKGRSWPLPHRARRWLIGLAVSTAMALLILVLLPLTIEWFIEYRLRSDIATRAEVLDVDFNPFTGRVRITGVDTQDPDGRLVDSGELFAEVRWRSLFDEELHLVAVVLRDAVMVVRYTDQGSWQVGRLELGGDEAVSAEEGLPAWFFSVEEALLENVRVELHGPGWQDTLHIDRARLAGLNTRTPEQSVTLEVAGTADDVPFALDVRATPFTAEPRFRGRFDLERLPVASLDWLAQRLQRDGVSIGTSIEVHLDYDVTLAEATAIVLDGELAMTEFAATAAGVDERMEGFGYRGHIEIEAGSERVRNLLDGALTITGYRHGRPAEGDYVEIRQVAWKGQFETHQQHDGTLVARHAGGGEGSGIRYRTAAADVAIDALDWQGDYRLDGSDTGMTLVLEGALHGRQLVIGNTEPAVTVQLGSVDWSMKNLQAAFSADGFSIDHPGRLALGGATVTGPFGMLAEPGTLAWDGVVRIKESGAEVVTDGELTSESLSIELAGEGDGYSADLGTLTWRGEVTRAAAGAVAMRGNLALKSLRAAVGEGQAVNLANLGWEGRIDTEPDGKAAATGRLAIDRLEASEVDGSVVRAEMLDWNGDLTATTVADGSVTRINASGELAARAVNVRDAELTWLDGEVLAVSGIELAQPGAIRLDGFSAKGLRLLQPQGGEPLAESGALQVTGVVRHEDGAIGIDTARIDALQLLLVRNADGLVLPGVEIGDSSPDDLADGASNVSGAVSESPATQPSGIPATASSAPDEESELPDELIDESRVMREPAAVVAVDTIAESESEGEADPIAASPAWQLGRFELGPESRLVFDDNAVAPPFHAELLFERFEIVNLASGADSEPGQLTLAARLGEYSRFELDGSLRPDPLQVDLSGRLTEFALPPLSPYTLTHLGHRIGSGQLTVELQIKVEGEQLAGEQQLTLNQVEFEAVPSAALDGFEKQIGMPLDAALGLLRDKQGNIHLKLPVGGRLDDPQFDLGDAIGQAVGKATRTAMIGILKLTLQPYGAILTAVELVGDLAANVRLDPLPFEAGLAEPDGTASEYLERLVKLLQERPGIQLRLCGRAVEADRIALAAALAELQETRSGTDKAAAAGAEPAPAAAAGGTVPPSGQERPAASAPIAPMIDDDQLLALASRRAEGVKRALVDAGAPSERLFLCHPALYGDVDAKPRIDLLL